MYIASKPMQLTANRIWMSAAALAVLVAPASLDAQSLSRAEQRIRDHAYRNRNEAIRLLAETVNINSGTMTFAGVRAVGDVFARELKALGFETKWVPMSEVNRAGHLIADRRPRARGRAARPRGRRLLLIGHLDTVFEGEGVTFQRVNDTLARGAGTSDMKGGNVVVIQALKALRSVGALDDMQVIVVFTGDEESPGEPLEIARRDLLEAARRSDVALGFESGEPDAAVVARRGSIDWVLEVIGRQAHSSSVFAESTGYGAIYEAARIVNGFRERLAGRPNLTFSPGVIVGGTEVTYDTSNTRGSAAGKTNIVPRSVVIHGDLRALTPGQEDSARTIMRSVATQGNLPLTSAEIRFGAGYPPMSPTAANYALLAAYDTVSRALRLPAVAGHDPRRRGAADISFVAPLVPGLDGLGPWGSGGHTPNEDINLNSLAPATARAAILMYRLSRR
jgi:glutamate carboxypeptidase